MKNHLFNICGRLLAFGVVGLTMAAVIGCNPEPDESDLYTATGETAADFIKRKPELSAFNNILNTEYGRTGPQLVRLWRVHLFHSNQ